MDELSTVENEEERAIRIGRLTLEALLLNLKGDERVLVRNLDLDNLSAIGTEDEIRLHVGEWLFTPVLMFFFNKEKALIEIQIKHDN
jgi:hypothetical protein